MKRIAFYVFSFFLVSITFFSCTLEGDMFDKTLLIGSWYSGTEYYRYDDGGTGATWETSDDVNETEAQTFSWTLVSAELTHIHVMTTGSAGVTKIYTVTKLTATSLEYKDDFGSTYSFTKVTDKTLLN